MTQEELLESVYLSSLEDLRMVADTLEDDGWAIRWVWSFQRGNSNTVFEADRGDRIIGIQVSDMYKRAAEDDVVGMWMAFAINGAEIVYSVRMRDPADAIRAIL
jgi:hypothetical protein